MIAVAIIIILITGTVLRCITQPPQPTYLSEAEKRSTEAIRLKSEGMT